MKTNLLYCALDVDDNAFHAFLISPKTGEFFAFRTRPQASVIIKKLNEFVV